MTVDAVSRPGPGRHSVSVAGVAVRDGRVLVIRRRDNGRWEPPGGILELSETVEDGLRREVREETGLDIEPVRLTGIYQNMPLGVIALVFRCEVTGGSESTSEETRSLAWLTPDQVPERMPEAYAVRVHDALASGPTPVRSTTAHDSPPPGKVTPPTDARRPEYPQCAD